MAQREQVISVSMKLSTKGFSEGLVLTAKQAKAMGKSIASALTLDSKSATNALKAIGKEKDALIENFKKLKTAVQDSVKMSPAATKQTTDKLKEVAGGLKTVADKARDATNAMKNVKFLIGNTNKNIDSVIKKLERLEEVANRIGNISVHVSSSGVVRGGGGSGGGTSSGTNNAGNYKTPAGPPRPPTISSRAQDDYLGPRLTQKEYDAAMAKSLREHEARLSRESASGKGGSKTPYKGFAEFEKEAAASGQKSADAFTKGFSSVTTQISREGDKAFRSFSRIFSANFLADALVDSLTGVFNQLQNLSVETAKYAARTEELGVVLGSLARMNNISTQTIVEQEVAVRRLNITTQDARETLARFINVGFDLKQAGPLARVAQDLAVIEGLSTSEELDKLVIAIQTLQSRNLRSAGVYMTVDEVLDRLAATSQRARDSFTTLEKQTAVLNDVLAYGARAAGTYDTAMETTSKQLRSMERYFFEAQNAVGAGLIPALQAYVDIGTAVLKITALMPNTFLNFIGTIGLLTTSLVLLKTTAVQTFATGIFGAVAGAYGSARNAGRGIVGKAPILSPEQTLKNQSLMEEARELSVRQGQRVEQLTQLRNEARQLSIKKKITDEEKKRLVAIHNQTSALKAQMAIDARRGEDINKRGGMTKADTFAAGLGKAGIVGTALVSVYQIVGAVREFNNSLYQLSAVDMTAVTKYSQELTRIKTDQATLNSDSVIKGKEALEIVGRMNEVSRGRLRGELASLDVNKEITKELRDQLSAQLQIEQGDYGRRLENKRRAALAEIRKSQENVTKVGNNLNQIVSAEEQLRQGLGGSAVPTSEIGILDKVLYYSVAGVGAIADTITMADEGWSNKRFANVMSQVGTVGARSMALAGIQDKTAETEGLSEQQFQARRQAITDYLEISEKMGDTNPLAAFEGDNAKIKLTKDQLEEVKRELQAIKEELRAEDWANIQKQIGDPTVNAFNTFQEQFDKQRATREKRLREIFNERAQQYGWDNNEINRRMQEQLNLADAGFLSGTQGKEAFTALESQVAQQIVVDRQTGRRRSPLDILSEQFNRLYGTDRKEEGKNPAGQGRNLRSAILLMRQQNLARQEAEDVMAEFLQASLVDQANSKLRKLVEKPLPDTVKAFSIDKFTKGMDDFINTSMDLGRSSESITETRTELYRLFQQDATKGIEALRVYNATLQEQQNLKKATEEYTDANNAEIQSLKNTTKILQAWTEVAELRQNVMLPIVGAEVRAQKLLLTSIQEQRDAEADLTAEIAVQFAKRTTYAQEFNNAVAGVFLDRQKEIADARVSSMKAFAAREFAEGNEDLFSNNPLVQAAAEQAEKLDAIAKNGGVMGQKVDATNALLTSANKIAETQTTDIKGHIRTGAEEQIKKLDDVKTGIVAAIKESKFDNLGPVPTSVPFTSGSSIATQWRNTVSSGTIANVARNFRTGGGPYAGMVQRASQLSGSPLNQVLAVGAYETDAFSKAGASTTSQTGVQGIFQVTQATFNHVYRKYNLQKFGVPNNRRDPYASAIAGAFYIKEIREEIIPQLNSNKRLNLNLSPDDIGAVASIYNSGPGFYMPGNKNYQRLEGRATGAKAYYGSGGSAVVDVKAVQKKALEQKKENDAAVAKAASEAKSTLDLAAATTKDIYAYGESLGLSPQQVYALFVQTKDYDPSDMLFTDNMLNTQQVIRSAARANSIFGRTNLTVAESKSLEEHDQKFTEFAEKEKKRIAQAAIDIKELGKLRELAYDTALDEYFDEAREERRLGTSTRAGQRDATNLRIGDLRSRSGGYFSKVRGEAELEVLKGYQSTLEEVVKLEATRDERRKDNLAYLLDQEQQFANTQLQTRLSLEDEETQLNIRIREARKETSDYTINLIRKEGIERRAEEQNTIEEIQRLRRAAAKAEQGLQNRLTLRQEQINEARSREREEALQRQLEVENAYKRLSDEFDPVEFRNRSLGKIVDMSKDSTTLMSDLFSDAFDDISEGFGGMIDRFTGRMGFFGETIGNFLKGIANNILGSFGKDFLNIFFPTSSEVKDAMNGVVQPVSEIASGENSYLDKGIKDILGIGGGGGVAGQSNDTSTALGNLAYAAGAAASALIGIAGHVGSTGMNMVGIMNMGMAKFGGVGIAGGGGGRGGTVPFNPFPNFARAINSEASSGARGIASDVAIVDNVHIAAGSVGGSIVDAAHGAGSAARMPKGILGRIGSGAKGLLNGKIGQQFIASLPMLGAGLGGMLGNEGGFGGILGQAGGLLGGLAGMAGLGALGIGGGISGILGGLGGFGAGLSSLFGGIGTSILGVGSNAAIAASLGATVVLAPIAAAALIGTYFLNRNKKRRKNETIRNTAMLEALPALQELLKGVKTDKIDGDEALTRADEIRKQYVEQMSKLDDKKTRGIALKDVSRLDAVIAEIKVAAKTQALRRDIDERIVPTYAQGGTGQGLIRVSRGETLFLPHDEGTFGGHHIAAANIPNFNSGGSYTGVRIRGSFDGKDNILTRVPKGTVIANPRQVSKIRQSRGFATGGVAGRSGSFTAQGAVVVQPPQVTAIIVFSPEEAEALGRQIPNSVIVGKVRHHVQKTGTTGLAGDIINSF